MSREEFRAGRLRAMEEVSAALLPAAEVFVAERDEGAFLAAVSDAFTAQWGTDFGISDNIRDAVGWFLDRIRPAVEKVVDVSDPRRIADWLGTAVVNGARAAKAASDRDGLEWTSRRDGKVRPLHVDADGQVQPVGGKFRVGEFDLSFPGEPVGPPEIWLNCRCVLAPASLTAAADDGTIDVDGVDDDGWMDEEPDDDDLDIIPDRVPWYSLMVSEGVRSGDGRSFSSGGVTWRDLPLPLRWQESDTGGHDGAVTIGTIENIWRDGDDVWASGWTVDSEAADRAIGLHMDGGLGGISIDADDVELAADQDDGSVEFSRGRISGATLVAIPAFDHVFFALGEPPTTRLQEKEVTDGYAGDVAVFKDYTPEERRRLAEKGEALDDGSFPIADCMDLRNAIQAIGRASDPEKVKAHIRKRKRELGCDDVDLPESWSLAASGEEFKRGKGWVTHPKETRRLHHFWTRGRGASKIGWGTSGSFRRARRLLSKYIDPMYLNRTVAQWYFDATGTWPGQKRKRSYATLGAHGTTAEDALRQGARVHAGEHTVATGWQPALQDLPQGTGSAGPSAAHGARTETGRAPQQFEDALPKGARVHAGEHRPEQARCQTVQDLQARGVHAASQDAPGAAVGEDCGCGTGRVLAVDRREDDGPTRMAGGPQVRDDHRGSEGRGQDLQSASAGLRVGEGSDTGRADHRPSVQSQTVLQPGSPGSGNRSGEYAPTMAAPALNLVASAHPVVESWYFDNPMLDDRTALIVDGDHVYGHLGIWTLPDGSPACHIGIKGVCREVPRSAHNYAYFRTGAVHTEKGRVSVGQLTMSTGHPSLGKNARAAAAHYDNTGTVVADVAAGEDEYGVWVSGKIRSTATDEQRHALAAGALSGDWREIAGGLELVAALVVNVPGFPIPRPALAASADGQLSLVAAGIVVRAGHLSDPERMGLAASVEEIAEAVDRYQERKRAKVASVALSKRVVNAERIGALLGQFE